MTVAGNYDLKIEEALLDCCLGIFWLEMAVDTGALRFIQRAQGLEKIDRRLLATQKRLRDFDTCVFLILRDTFVHSELVQKRLSELHFLFEGR